MVQEWKVQTVVEVDASINRESLSGIKVATGLTPEWPGVIAVEVSPVVRAEGKLSAEQQVEAALLRQGIQVVFLNAQPVRKETHCGDGIISEMRSGN